MPDNNTQTGFTAGTNVVDLAEFGGIGNIGKRWLLRKNGFQYLDDSGKIVTEKGGNLGMFDIWKKANQAARAERAYKLSGYTGNTTGWSNDALALRKQQLESDANYTTIAAPKQTPRTYDYDFGSEFYSGDNSGYADITTGILKALYDNGKFDILDSMKGSDGKIGLDGLKQYHSSLGLQGINSGYFDEASINAMVKAGALSPEQAAGFIISAKAIAPKPAGIVDEGAAITNSVKWTPETIATASTNALANGVLNGEFGNYTDRKTALGNRYNEVQREVNNRLRRHKQGGQIMKYFQQGGSVAAQQVAQEQVQQQRAQLEEIFMAIAKNPKETLMALQKQGVQPQDVIALAQKMADTSPAAKEALSALSQMSQFAKNGAKLQYIKRLRGECPEGYEAKSYKIGGKVCKKCEKIEADKCGGKAKKTKKCEEGGESPIVSEFKELRCGGKAKKAKKCEIGGTTPLTLEFKCGGKAKKAKKCEEGGEAQIASEFKCGGKPKKAKKCEIGGTFPLISEFKCGGKTKKPKAKKCEDGGESPIVSEFKSKRKKN